MKLLGKINKKNQETSEEIDTTKLQNTHSLTLTQTKPTKTKISNQNTHRKYTQKIYTISQNLSVKEGETETRFSDETINFKKC